MDSRAEHLCSGLLHTCCRSELHSKNRASQSSDHSLSNSCTLTLGNDDSMMPINTSLKMTSLISSIFIQDTWLVYFPSCFSLISSDLILIDARVCVQHLISRQQDKTLYLRCPPTSWMEYLINPSFRPVFSLSLKSLLNNNSSPFKTMSCNAMNFKISS